MVFYFYVHSKICLIILLKTILFIYLHNFYMIKDDMKDIKTKKNKQKGSYQTI